MSDGFSAFKAMAIGLGAVFLVTAIAPNIANGQFDALRLVKGKDNGNGGGKSKGKGKTVLPAPKPGDRGSNGGGLSGDIGGGTGGAGGSTSNSFYTELSMIQTNFDVNSELGPSWGTGEKAKSAAPDTVGAFRFICNAGQLLNDDPIVYPGQPGRSHLHQYYGNTSANAHSTYASLRTTGASTCMSPLNRSAYWMPAMLDGKGKVIRPDYIAIYYKRRPISDPKCSLTSGDPKAEGNCVTIPNGLKYVFGYDMISGKSPTGAAYFNCDGPGAKSAHYPSITAAAAGCPAGVRLGAIIHAPSCWDGKNLDSANHRDHVAYGGYGSWGFLKCPSTHPYVIPEFTLQAWYSVVPGDDVKLWRLSSDDMRPDLPAGSTFHADWFGAWDNNVLSMWMDNCINKLLSCAGGDLGNGKQMKQFAGFSMNATPRLVAAPK